MGGMSAEDIEFATGLRVLCAGCGGSLLKRDALRIERPDIPGGVAAYMCSEHCAEREPRSRWAMG
jgi:hypothetical protein